MKPTLRKLLFTTHVVVSIGWFGAAAGVLALAIAALASASGGSAMYEATEVIWRSVIIPLSLAALATGIVQALGTEWGLFRHYWVLAKLAITTGAVLLLLLHTNSLLPALAHAAIDAPAHGHGGIPPGVHLVVAAGGTLLLLVIAAVLSVYKPWGKTLLARRS
jgi:hypothetical protein